MPSKNGIDVFAPKGLLKMLILEITSQRPTTGVEIMQQVPEMTDHAWTPSPGSVYYLLGELEHAGLIIHVPTGETGIKRYVTSEKGKLSLDSFKLDAKKSLHKQIVMLRVLSDLTGNDSLSQAISHLTGKVAPRQS
jgi:DNA-binding PadR family transcriptional regulator